MSRYPAIGPKPGGRPGFQRMTIRARDLRVGDFLIGSGRRVTGRAQRMQSGRLTVEVYNPISDATRVITFGHGTSVTIERPEAQDA